MNKVVITGERRVSLVDARVPEPKDDWVLVKVLGSVSPYIDLLVSHQLPMSKIQDGFELCARGECAKVVVDPQK